MNNKSPDEYMNQFKPTIKKGITSTERPKRIMREDVTIATGVHWFYVHSIVEFLDANYDGPFHIEDTEGEE